MALSYKLPRGINRRKLIISFAISAIVCIALFNSQYSPDLYFAYLGPLDDVSCYYTNKSDVLQAVEDRSFSPPEKSIYFHETSCKGGLNSRQACAVESAARAHPDWQINVIFSAPISEKAFASGNLALLQTFDNVKFSRLHLLETIKNTPVEDLVLSGALNRTRWRISHTSDLLRYLSLFKWGGIYLDLDMIVGKSLEPLGKNWAAIESDTAVGSGVLAFSRDEIGRKFAKAAIWNFVNNFRGDVWGQNGPGVITRVLQEFCSTAVIRAMPTQDCQGFKVYDSMFLIPWERAIEYFEPGDINVKDPYLYHIWNKVSHSYSAITKHSRYIKLVKKFCPSVYQEYGKRLTSGGDWAGSPEK